MLSSFIVWNNIGMIDPTFAEARDRALAVRTALGMLGSGLRVRRCGLRTKPAVPGVNRG